MTQHHPYRIKLRTLVYALIVFTTNEVQINAQITTTDIRIVAANITSGSNQQYGNPGINIFKGLQPDIVAIQEFNYGNNSNEYAQVLVDEAFGPQFYFFREPYRGFFPIPNGVISRWPILDAGYWVDADPGINQRGFVWSRIDIPGTNDLYVISIHLKSGSFDASRRAAQSDQLKSLIFSNIPPDSLFVIAGDLNIHSPTEYALTNLFSITSDLPIPTDALSNRNTNAGRNSRYDYILSSLAMTSMLIAVTMPSQSFSNGLVFDSRVYQPLSDATPVGFSDSAASGMQHMAVVRDYRIIHDIDTNMIEILAPSILEHPSSIYATQNDTGQLSFASAGNGSIVYRWRKDGLYMPGMTNQWINFGSIQPTNIGSYQAVVANESGLSTSETARIDLMVPEALLSIVDSGALTWTGLSNLAYRVQSSSDLLNSLWTNVAIITSLSTNISLTNATSFGDKRFLRVVYP